MIVLDASVLIAHLNPADTHHDEATRILLRGDRDALIVHSSTMAEVLVGGARIGRAAEMRADLESMGIELADQDVEEPVRLATLRAATGLKLPDCCVLGTAIRIGARLATFDRVLARVGGARGIVVLP